MSVYYDIVEHFSAKTLPNGIEYTEGEVDAVTSVEIMQRQVALLCMKTMCGNKHLNPGVTIHDLEITIDGKMTKFNTCEYTYITSEIQHAISSMRSAQEINVYLDYSFEWRVPEDYLGIGPFVLSNYLGECEKEVFEYVDFVFHNYADCSDDESSGILAVYGKRNGEVSKGVIDFLPTTIIPEYGYWTSPVSTIMLDEIMIKHGCEKQIEKICSKLIEPYSSDYFQIDEGLFSLMLNNVELDSKETIERLLKLCSELVQLLVPPENLSINSTAIYKEFTNMTEKSLDMFVIDISYDGEVSLFIANGLEGK